MLSIWSNLCHNHSKNASKSPSKAAKNKKSKNDSNVKVVDKGSKNRYSFYLKSFIVVVISVIAFYYLPWERFVFSEEEILELLSDYDTESLNFMATNEDHFNET